MGCELLVFSTCGGRRLCLCSCKDVTRLLSWPSFSALIGFQDRVSHCFRSIYSGFEASLMPPCKKGE